MSIELYPSIAKIKRNGVYENLPGFVPETGSIATQQMIATSESSATAQYVHNKGEYFRLNDTLYQAIVKINVGDAIVVGTNCEVAVIGNDLTHVANSIAAYELGIASSSHNTGDYFMVGETLYVATADIQVGDTISTSTNCRLAVVGDELSGLKTAIDYKVKNDEFYTQSSWSGGYLGSTRISTGETSNKDVYSVTPTKVYKDEVISISLAYAPYNGAQYAYVYYAWCDANGNYSTRYSFSGNAKYTKVDSNYRYFEATITVPENGYFIMSFRNRNANYAYDGISHVIGSYYSSKILEINESIVDIENDIADINNDVSGIKTTEQINLFPSEYELPINILHRGLATDGYPENTISAYKDAVSKGWEYLETDIRKTSDGVWVLLHDADINRTARNADGTTISETVYISDITYAQALEYDFGIYVGSEFAGTKIPTLDAFLNFCNKTHTYPIIEVKNSTVSDEDANAVWAIVEKYQMQNRCFWLSSSLGGVEKYTAKNPYAPAITTSASDWTYIDPATFPTLTPPYATSYKTGKNKVLFEKISSAFSSKSDMDNFVDYCHYFGIYAGVYAPTTQVAIEACSDRLDCCTTQYMTYSDVKANEIEN